MTNIEILKVYTKIIEAQVLLESQEFSKARMSLKDVAEWLLSRGHESECPGTLELEIFIMGLDSSLKLLTFYDALHQDVPEEIQCFIVSELETLQHGLMMSIVPSECFGYKICPN